MASSGSGRIGSGRVDAEQQAEIDMRARRGGRRQRAEARCDMGASVEGSATRQLFDNQLASSYIEDWAWGHASACEVQRKAKLAFDEEVKLLQRFDLSAESASQTMNMLAALGNDGKIQATYIEISSRVLANPIIPSPPTYPCTSRFKSLVGTCPKCS